MDMWFCIEFVCMNKIVKGAEEKVGNSKFVLHAVSNTKKKMLWRQCFWLTKLKAYGNVGLKEESELIKLTFRKTLEHQLIMIGLGLPSREEYPIQSCSYTSHFPLSAVATTEVREAPEPERSQDDREA